MKLRKRWLIAVLICGVQLIAGLWMASCALNFFESRTISMLSRQITDGWCEQVEQLTKLKPEAISDSDGLLSANLIGDHWNNTGVQSRLLLIGDTVTDSLIGCPASNVAIEIGSNPSPASLSLSQLSINPLSSQDIGSISELLASPHGASFNGWLTHQGQQFLVHVHRLTESKALLIGRPTQEVFAEFNHWIKTARNVCFTGILLLGFVTIFLTTSTMQKFETQLAGFHNQLQSMVEKRTVELNKTKNGIIFGLAKLAESRDNDTGDHLDRIRYYVLILANELRGKLPAIDDAFIQNLALASSLHDIGKVGIPDAVLLKPGRLSDLERKIMQFHTTIGCECLEAIENKIGSDAFLSMAVQIARSHHERWDGKGYPENIAGDAIPLAARIVAVADVYDALTSRRPYKEPMSHEKSAAIICAESGTQFDPLIIEAFQNRQEQFRSVMEKYHQEIDDSALVPAIAKLQLALIETPVSHSVNS